MNKKKFEINRLISQGAKLRGAGSDTTSTPWGVASDNQNLIDLRVGMPDREKLPSLAFARHISDILESGDAKALEYEYGSGDPDLKSILSDPIMALPIILPFLTSLLFIMVVLDAWRHSVRPLWTKVT